MAASRKRVEESFLWVLLIRLGCALSRLEAASLWEGRKHMPGEVRVDKGVVG